MSDESPKRSGPKRFSAGLALAFCAGCAVFISCLVVRYAVAVPMLDDWEMVPPVVKAHSGGLTFADLFEQQQESRTFFPRLIFVALSFTKYWDGRIEMILGAAICLGTGLGVYRLFARSALSRGATIAGVLLSVALIFSPAQHELWLLASGFPSFIPAFCIVWALCAVEGRLSTVAKFWSCAGLAVLASFTLSNGLLAWGLTFPVLLANNSEPQWKRWLGCWLGATALCAAVYFWHWSPRSDLPAFAPRKSLLGYWCYFSAFLGAGLGRAGNENPFAVSIGIGTTLFSCYVAGAAWCLWRWRDRDHRARLLPWLALGAYSVGNGCLAALGRIDWGIQQALESRYVAYSLYLAVSVVAIAALWLAEFRKTQTVGKRGIALFALSAFLVVTFAGFELFCAVASLPYFALRSAAARLGRSGILFGQVLDTTGTIRNTNYPRPLFVRQSAEALDRLHLLRIPLLRTREVDQLRHTDDTDATASGWIDGLTRASDGTLTAWGWAALLARKRPADGVLLAYWEGNRWIGFALSDAVINRPDVVRVLQRPEQLWSGWRVSFAGNAPPPAAEISAWAVDSREAKLYRLKSNQRLFNP